MKIVLNLLFIISVLALFSCSNNEKIKPTHEPYSILIEKFNADFHSSISSFNTLELDTLYVPSNSVNSVILGYFNSIKEARNLADNLIIDSIISEYKLVKNDSIQTTFNSKFQFVGLNNGIPSLLGYDFHRNKFDILWSEWGRNVYGFYQDFEKNVSYFITSLSWGRRGGIPYILNTRLYFMDNYKETIKRKKIFGKGNLINGFWLNDNFQVYFYALDSIKTTIIKRVALQFDYDGNKLASDSSDYDLLSGGFPLPPKKNLQYFSPSNKYRIILGNKDSLNTISLYDEVKADSSAIVYSDEELLQIEWSFDDEFSIVRTAKIHTNEKGNSMISTLTVYNNFSRKILYQINGYGIKNFFIFGNNIVYDDGIESNSKIYFYNFKENKIIRTVEHKDGLGVFTYPQVPD